MKRGTSTSHRTTTENKDAAANVTAKSIWFKRQLDMAVAAVGSVALCATMAFVAALTGYVSSSDLDSAAYKMAASQAEITESLITDSDGVRKVYNSAAIAFPDGHADSYQKMHRAGSEETAWSLPGSTPVMFEMPEWTGSDGKPLKAGIDICRDGHFYPELGRYYAASGAELFLHPTATTGNAWYRESRMGSYTDRDGLAVITDNVWGPDGYPLDVDGNPIYFVDENGDTVSSGKDIAGYNYAGVGSDPFRTSTHHQRMERQGRHPVRLLHGQRARRQRNRQGRVRQRIVRHDVRRRRLRSRQSGNPTDELVPRRVQCHELQRSPLLQDVRSARQTDHLKISGHV